MDLGRPERFLQHAADLQAALADVDGRVVPVGVRRRSAAGAVGADLLGRTRAARALGARQRACVGGYLGSYTGVLLASTAVPVWARSHLFLGPIFVCHGDRDRRRRHAGWRSSPPGLPRGPPDARARWAASRRARWRAELMLSTVNERRLGGSADGARARARRAAVPAAKWLVRGGPGAAARAPPRRPDGPPRSRQRAATWPAGLCFRYAWVAAGRASAQRRRGRRRRCAPAPADIPHMTSDVSASTGTVRGRWEDGVAVYRGIPFAAPPVGPRRFTAPQPAALGGVRDASRFGPPPPQPGRATEGDEWLNRAVWTPDPDRAGSEHPGA